MRHLGDYNVDHAVEPRAVVRHCPFADEARGNSGIAHRVAVSRQSRRQQIAIALRRGRLNRAGRAEIEQDEAAGFRLIPVVCEIGIGLHQPEFEQFAQDHPDQRSHDRIAHVLRGVGDAFDGHTFDEAHRKHLVGAELVINGGHDIIGRIGEQRAEARHLCSFAGVIRFFMQLPFRLGEERRKVDFLGQQSRNAQQRRDIIDVGVDAVAHAGILDLHRKVAAIGRRRAVDLTD